MEKLSDVLHSAYCEHAEVRQSHIEAAEELEAKLHAAEVERDAALFQLHEQDRKLDAAEMAVSVLREQL